MGVSAKMGAAYEIFSAIFYVTAAISIFSSALLLVAVYKNTRAGVKQRLLLPWLILCMMGIIFLIVTFIAIVVLLAMFLSSSVKQDENVGKELITSAVGTLLTGM